MIAQQATNDVTTDVRSLSGAGIFALIIDGQDPAQIAAAFDISASDVRNIASMTMRDILTQSNLCHAAKRVFPCTVRKFPDIAAWLAHIKKCSWDDFLNQRELIEVLETRAYFKAFQNSVVNEKGKTSHAIQANLGS